MSFTDFAQLIAASLAVAFVVSVVAYAVSSAMELTEEEDAARLRVQLGVDRNGDVYPGRKAAR